MARQANHKCLICGTGYFHCNDCTDAKTFTPWRRVACSVECYQAYLVLVEYQNGRMTKDEAADALKISGFDTASAMSEAKLVFDQIMAQDAPVAEGDAVAEEEAVHVTRKRVKA